ncbi:hypothetical protein ACWCO3_31745 [Micromonospora sp. NPDC002411]
MVRRLLDRDVAEVRVFSLPDRIAGDAEVLGQPVLGEPFTG